MLKKKKRKRKRLILKWNFNYLFMLRIDSYVSEKKKMPFLESKSYQICLMANSLQQLLINNLLVLGFVASFDF